MIGEPLSQETSAVQPAAPMRRAAAWLVDQCVGGIPLALIVLRLLSMGFNGPSTSPVLSFGVVVFLLWVAAWVALATQGRTIGKAVAGLVVVHAQQEGNPPFGLGMMIIRAVVKAFMLGSGILFIVGLFFMLSDETRYRSATDRLVASQVVLK